MLNTTQPLKFFDPSACGALSQKLLTYLRTDSPERSFRYFYCQQNTQPVHCMACRENIQVHGNIIFTMGLKYGKLSHHHHSQVSLGLADVYVNTGPSTFQWDTCAPHSLLAATGGGLLDCK